MHSPDFMSRFNETPISTLPESLSIEGIESPEPVVSAACNQIIYNRPREPVDIDIGMDIPCQDPVKCFSQRNRVIPALDCKAPDLRDSL